MQDVHILKVRDASAREACWFLKQEQEGALNGLGFRV